MTPQLIGKLALGLFLAALGIYKSIDFTLTMLALAQQADLNNVPFTPTATTWVIGGTWFGTTVIGLLFMGLLP